MRILGIETSCDETAAAVVEVKVSSGERLAFRVLSNVVASQIKIHAKTGGVVPEVAARKHAEVIIPVVERALREAAKVSKVSKVTKVTSKAFATSATFATFATSLDTVAVTAGPGLMTALLVGVEVARTLSWLWKKPVVAVNHLAGHVYANWLNPHLISPLGRGRKKRLEFPILALIVSGGHTELVLMRKHLDFKVIGSTRDDAAGEAFDKVAKMLGLGYPGGPAIAAEAALFATRYSLLDKKPNSQYLIANSPIHFPRPMIDSPDFDFSFSGLKTAVLCFLKNRLQQNNVRPDIKMLRRIVPQICWKFQEAVVDVLVSKTIRAAKKYGVKAVLLGGGVAANKRLREQLVATINSELSTIDCILPQAEYTTDNAAMIAAAGYFMAEAKQYTPWKKLDVDPNWELSTKFEPIAR